MKCTLERYKILPSGIIELRADQKLSVLQMILVPLHPVEKHVPYEETLTKAGTQAKIFHRLLSETDGLTGDLYLYQYRMVLHVLNPGFICVIEKRIVEACKKAYNFSDVAIAGRYHINAPTC